MLLASHGCLLTYSDAAYRALAKSELWRHVEGTATDDDIADSERRLHESLIKDQGPENPEDPWSATRAPHHLKEPHIT